MKLLPEGKEKKVLFILLAVVICLVVLGLGVILGIPEPENKGAINTDPQPATIYEITSADVSTAKKNETFSGTVTAITPNSVSVLNGGIQMFIINSDTVVTKGQRLDPATAAEIKVGSKLAVGFDNTDNIAKELWIED